MGGAASHCTSGSTVSPICHNLMGRRKGSGMSRSPNSGYWHSLFSLSGSSVPSSLQLQLKFNHRDQWSVKHTFPYVSPLEFNHIPSTLQEEAYVSSTISPFWSSNSSKGVVSWKSHCVLRECSLHDFPITEKEVPSHSSCICIRRYLL